jgi:hypothetical protein
MYLGQRPQQPLRTDGERNQRTTNTPSSGVKAILVAPTFNAFNVKARVGFITTEGKLKSISVIVELAGMGVTKYTTIGP